MLAPFAHLADTSGAPPYMGLRVDQDWWVHRVTIGYPFRRESIDEISRRRQSLRFTLPECDEPGGVREL